MAKQTLLTRDEMMAYEVIERMKLNASGYIGNSPYWYGWALRDAYLERCKSYETTATALNRQLQEANELGIAQEKRIFELQNDVAALKSNAIHDKEVMRQAADRIASLKTDFENLQQQLLIDGHYESCACVQAASIDCSCGKRDSDIQALSHTIKFAPPESITQHAAVNALRAMSPQEALEWIETAYRLRSEANQRELQGVMGD